VPGFGSNPFGADPFGDWDWGKRVFFEQIPELHRLADPANGSPHEKWAATQAKSFSDLRRKIRDFGTLRDPRMVRTEFDEQETLVLGARLVVQGTVEQRGVRGTVTGVRVFTGDRAHFTFADLGKTLAISGSANPLNNRSVIVAGVLSATQVVTDPPLELDVGPLRWELRAKVNPKPDEITIEILRGNVQNLAPGWRISDGYASFEVLGRTQFKESEDERKLLTDREGEDGVIDAFGRLTSATAAFIQADLGRKLVLSGSSIVTNEGLFEITEVVSSTTVVLDQVLTPDVGPLFWGIRRRAEIVIRGPAVPTGIMEQGGEGATVPLVPGRLEVPLGQFTNADIGKLITIRADGSPSNGTYEILAVNGSTNIDVSVAIPVGATTYHWEVRTPTNFGDETQVLANAPSLLQYLAQDFGIEVDTRDDEEFQRRWVESVSRWIGMKGTEDGYVFLGQLTGFTVTVLHLFRVTQEIYLASPIGDRYAVGEDGPGRSGTDGSLVAGVGAVDFTSPTAAFEPTDVGRHIEIAGSGSGNDGLRTIESVISATQVRFRAIDTATVPDASNGALVWRIVRLYSSNAPFLPVYDEINTDIAREENPTWTPDTYCWESNGTIEAEVSITSVTPAALSPFPITYTVVGDGAWDIVSGLGVGKWRLTDSLFVDYYLESIPVEAPETGAGRTGVDGSIVDLGFAIEFTAPSGNFAFSDVGRRLRISGSGSGNNNLYEIIAWVGPTQVHLNLGAIAPDVNNGALGWSVVRWSTTVVATAPPSLGTTGGLTYECPVQFSCDYCGSNKILVTGTTSLLMEDPFGRLFERLEQARPAHVEFVRAVGMHATGTVRLTASVDTGALLLMEDGDFLLLEDGGFIVLE
jgi:hypothetical protein